MPFNLPECTKIHIYAFKFIRMYQNMPFNLPECTKMCLLFTRMYQNMSFNLPECTITRMYLDVSFNLPKMFSLLMALASIVTIYVIIDSISTE